MIKNLIWGVLGLAAFVVVAITILLLYVGWGALRQPPAYALTIEKYYVCSQKNALHDGIFGKGPSKQYFKPDQPSWCWRWEWKEIERAEFMRLASEWYAVDWSEEGDWWYLRK